MGEKVTVGDVLRQRATGPGAERLAFDDGQRQLSFAGLLERATDLAAAFQSRGVKPRDRVALIMSSGVPFVEAFWGLQLVGAVPCALNPSVPSATLSRRVDAIRPTWAVCDEDVRALKSVQPVLVSRAPGVDELALLQLTSGTSGDPRAAMVSHRNVFSYLDAFAHDLGPDDIFVCWVPVWHDLGLLRFVVGTVYYGASCHIVQPAIRTIPEWLRTISRVRGTVTGGPDFCYRIAARMVDPAQLDLSSLRWATIAAEPVRRSTIQLFETRFGIPGALVPAYGLAEATLGVTTHLPGDDFVVDARGNVSCGTAPDGIEVRAGRSENAPEEILVRGDVVFAGYFEAPDDTRRIVRDGWLHTGDIGYLDSSARLFVLGRRSGMIKRAGSVIAPRELEDAALRAVDVRAAAAVTLPLAPHGEDTIAVVAEAEKSARRSNNEIAAGVTHEVVAALGFAPGRVIVAPPRTIPRTVNGKVRYDHLRSALMDGLVA